MKKTIIIFFILLAASLSQSFGQTKLLYKDDFGGNNTTNTKFSQTGIVHGYTNLTFDLVAPNAANYPAGVPGNGHYTIATSTAGAVYGAWWGTNATYPPFYDHTYGTTGNGLVSGTYTAGSHGYMMVINAYHPEEVFYQDTIRNLCPNTHLLFEAYAANLINSNSTYAVTNPANTNYRANPWLKFIIRDLASGDSITASDPQEIKKSTVVNVWQQIKLEFSTGSGTGDIIIQVMDTVTDTRGNDFLLDDFAVYLKLPTLSFSNAVNYFCLRDPMNLPITYNADSIRTTFGNSPYIQWLYHTNPTDTITKWTPVAGGLLNVVGPICTATAQAGYYMAVIGANIDPATISNNYTCCSISSTTEVQASPPNTLYWKKTPANRNWNDSRNWELAGGAAVSYYPGTCNDVHIPGYSSQYPSLDTLVSGNFSACKDIWFHFGGMIEKPHLLIYANAHVQYNFGVNGANADPHSSASILERGRWYALAAPLQKMASGDFSVGGYPNFWQQSFITSHQDGGEGTLSGDWYSPENNNAWNIESQNNAIAVWAGDYNEVGLFGEGPLYQTMLNNLHGVLEMPYFENPAIYQYHRGFEHTGGVSYFKYYDYKKSDLPFVDKTPGSITRGSEAYRFVYEDVSLFQKALDGTKVVYTMPVAPSQEIMIGNPFMSELNFDSLAAENPGIDTYRLYKGLGSGSSNYFSYSTTTGAVNDMTQYIAPLQAFFITTASDPSLKFYPDDLSLAIVADYQFKSSASSGKGKPDVLYLRATSQSGESWLTLSMQNVQKNNLILLLPVGYPDVPQIYATDGTGQKNAIQFEGKYVENVSLGILSKSSDDVTLTVYNKEKLNTSTLTLWDKYLDKKIDLKTTDSYTFKNLPEITDRFLLGMDKVITGISPANDTNRQVFVNVSGNTLFVSASSGIENVSVISLQGITVSKGNAGARMSYTTSLELPSGLYLVAVKLTTGETKVMKIRK